MDPMSRAVAYAGESIAQATKALTVRFGGTRASWTMLTGRSRINYRREIGDGSSNSIVMAAIGWIARNSSEASLIVEEATDPKRREWERSDDPGAQRMEDLLRRPNPFWGGRLMNKAVMADYWSSGNAIIWKIRDLPGGAVGQLWWIPSIMVEPKGTETEYLTSYDYRVTPSTVVHIPPEDVIHYRWGIDPVNPRRGLSPLGGVLREIFTDEEAANFTAAILRNAGVPGLVVVPGDEMTVIDEDDADAIKQKLAQRFGGDNRGSTAVLSSKVVITQLGYNPQQMMLRDVRKIPEERVTAVIGLPAIVAGMGAGLDRSTFANFGEAREAAYEENIIPTHADFRDVLDVAILPDFVGDPTRFRTMHDYSQVRVLQEDENEKVTRANGMVGGGYAMVSEARRLVGLNVEDHHDYFLRSPMLAEVADDPAFAEIPETPEPPPPPEVPPPPDPNAPPPEVPPVPPVPPVAPQPPQNGPGPAKGRGVKAKARGARSIVEARSRIVDRATKVTEKAVAKYFDGMAGRVIPKIQVKAKADPTSAIDWDAEDEALDGVLTKAYAQVGEATFGAIGEQVGVAIAWDLTERGAANVMGKVANRVTMINDESRSAIRSVVLTGIETDANADKMERDLRDLLKSWGEDGGRAHIIALTESGNAFNAASVSGYRESGLVESVEVFDGDECGWTEHDDPDMADGSTRSLDDAEAYPLSHPHCQRAFGPVVQGTEGG